jgi:hypothetical protein
MLHVARGDSLRETVVRAKFANWANISDVASAQTSAQERGVAAFVVYRIGSRKPRVPGDRAERVELLTEPDEQRFAARAAEVFGADLYTPPSLYQRSAEPEATERNSGPA